MPTYKGQSRRAFLRHLGISAAAMPFAMNLPSLARAAGRRKQRLIVIFSPNGIVPATFWPDEVGPQFTLKESLRPLAPFQKQLLLLRGVGDLVRGDGDNHMRGMGCLLTGIELFPGNIQGGSHTPAGWSSGISLDQEMKNRLQADPATRTRFGSLELGVLVPERADTWTRMVYAGPNRPVTPIDDPYQLFARLYGRRKQGETLRSVLDELGEDFQRLRGAVPADDRAILDEHAQMVREMEKELAAAKADVGHAVPEPEPGVRDENDNMPRLSTMQIDLLVGALAADFARIATLQYTNSVGQARMRWLGVQEGHHELSHAPDGDQAAQQKLTRINTWYCEQVAYLASKLQNTPEPGGDGSMLDHTLIVWTNELGKGNSHTLDDIPFVMVGGGLGFRMGRSLRYRRAPHNRLLLALAAAMGHPLERFGNPTFCGEGPLGDLS